MAKKSTTYTATTPSGAVLWRTSHRVYTHVVAYRYPGGQFWFSSWCGCHDLAVKAYNRLAKNASIDPSSLQIIEAVIS